MLAQENPDSEMVQLLVDAESSEVIDGDGSGDGCGEADGDHDDADCSDAVSVNELLRDPFPLYADRFTTRAKCDVKSNSSSSGCALRSAGGDGT